MVQTLIAEPEGYGLLRTYGIPVPEYAVARTADEAVAAAEAIGYPVVMKIVSPQIVHKSDAGGVVLSIGTRDETRAAFASIMTNTTRFNPSASVRGVMVARQLEEGLELIIGGKTDATFGKVISVGLGGTLVELIRDVAIRILPIGTDEIRAMIRELRGYPLIGGFRTEPRRDEEELVRIIEAVVRFFLEHSEVTEFDINPLRLYEHGACIVDARVYVDREHQNGEVHAAREMPHDILEIRSVAVVGASPDPGKVGYAVVRNMLPFPGDLYPVNPKHTMILGRKTYPSLAAVPGPVDAAVIAVPARTVPQVVEEAGRKKVPLVIILSSGFREYNDEGKNLEDQILAIAQRNGTRILGPNCLGLMIPRERINTTFDPLSPKEGSIAFISQSGAIVSTIIDWSLPEGVGFSSVISVGNQADLTIEDFVRYAGADPATRAIILYIEQVKNGKQFYSMVSEVTKKKPVVVIKSGSSRIGQMAAVSHTGSLAGSHEVYLAAFRQAGAIAVPSIRDAFQAAELLASEGYPKGIRAVVISNAGGFAVLAADYAERYCIDLIEFSPDLMRDIDSVLPPNWSRKNPIDMVGDSGHERFAKTFDLMIKNQDLWDIAFVIAVPSAISDPIRVANELVRFSKHTHKMIVGCMIGGDSMKTPLHILRDAGVPNFPDLEDAFRAVGTICRHWCGTVIHDRSCPVHSK